MPETEPKRPRRLNARLRQRAFLKAYSICGRISEAARIAQIDRQDHKRWYKADPVYRMAFDDHQEETAQLLEDEAIRRAYEGVKRPVLYQGRAVKIGGSRKVLYETQYSDTLLIALLKRFRPALYRENTVVEHTGSIELVERMQQARKRLIEMKKNDQANNAGTAG